MRLGVLIDNSKKDHFWTARVLYYLQLISNTEVFVFSFERSSAIDKETQINDSRSLLSHKMSQKYLLKQLQFERNRYIASINIEATSSCEIDESLYSNEVGIDTDTTDTILKYNIDILLMLHYHENVLQNLTDAKINVWSICFSDSLSFYNNFVGFKEILHRESICTVHIIQFKNSHSFEIIDTAYVNRHLVSWAVTQSLMLNSALSLCLALIKKNGVCKKNPEKELHKLNNSVLKPTISESFRYFKQYYKHLFKGLIRKLKAKQGKRYKVWALFLGSGNFLDSNILELNPVSLPKDEFWADPFLFKYENKEYVFFENYSYSTGLGKISCGSIKNNSIVEVKDIITMDSHLSFPFIFEEEGEIFMIPETSAKKRLEVYKCVSFPTEWRLITTAFEGEVIFDAFIFKDESKNYWLFANKQTVLGQDNTCELHIYQIDSILLKSIRPHKKNPVLMDSRTARNGGSIFKYKGDYFRPSQSNTDGVYGKGLNINKIVKLDLEDYIERTESKFSLEGHLGLIGMHHLHQIENKFVFDAAFAEL